MWVSAGATCSGFTSAGRGGALPITPDSSTHPRDHPGSGSASEGADGLLGTMNTPPSPCEDAEAG